jgi:prepilin peptidase CpaA
VRVGLAFNIFVILFAGSAIVFDVFQRRIPNWLVLAGVVVGFTVSASQEAPRLYESVLGFVLGIGILIVPFALGWLGAGDVKLLGAMGALLGIKLLPRIFFYTALCGLLLAILSIVLKRLKINMKVFPAIWGDLKLALASGGKVLPPGVTERVIAGSHAVPYGVAIALGALVALYGDPKGDWAGF